MLRNTHCWVLKVTFEALPVTRSKLFVDVVSEKATTRFYSWRHLNDTGCQRSEANLFDME